MRLTIMLRAAVGELVAAAEWLWRDPVRAVVAKAPARLVGGGYLLIALRIALGDLDPRAWWAHGRWRVYGARISQDPSARGVWRLCTRSGEAAAPPRRLELSGSAAAAVSLLTQDGGIVGGGWLDPGDPLILLAQGPVTLRVIGGGHALVLHGRPRTGLGVLLEALRNGSALPEALRRALPPKPWAHTSPPDGRYRKWLARRAVHAPPAPARGPQISVLMPVRDPDPEHLRAAIRSVQAQTYRDWTLCIADDGSRRAGVAAVLAEAVQDPRVRLHRLDGSRGVSAATNIALGFAEGEIVAFMDHDDLLTPEALAAMVEAFGAPGVVAAYSDEDTVDARGRPRSPTFKTRFDQERLLSQNFANHLFCARADLVQRLGGLREGYEGAQDHDLVLRIADAKCGAILHVPQVLYHWRRFAGGLSFSQREPGRAAAARRAAVEDHLARRGLTARVETAADGFNRLIWPLPTPSPRVSVIVPTRDRPDLLDACLASLLAVTAYPAMEILVVDNGSESRRALECLQRWSGDPRVRVLHEAGPFNHSALNNQAAAQATGSVLALLNDDVIAIESAWLEEMVRLAIRPDVGTVGAKLFYPDGRIQHAGVVLGLGALAVAGHELRGAPGEAVGLQSRLQVVRETDAVTAACLVVERSKYQSIGGLDAAAFPVAFNDVDFCLRLEAAGLRNLWTPHARLIHLESASRNRQAAMQRAVELAADADRMKARWGERLTRPDYNPALSTADETFSLA